MSQRGLEALLHPESIVVIGASVKTHRPGYWMMRNLLAGGFHGPIMPVNPAYTAVCGVLTWPDVTSLPISPDLAIICTHAHRNLGLLDALGEKGCKACIILSAPPDSLQTLKACASRWQIRLLGPNSLGLLAPWQGLNASFSPLPCNKGKIAFISQSSAIANTILDWAQLREIGFSWFIALGDSLDIDIDELLDYLSRDGKTRAILLYLEHIRDARRFVSAARSASRNKPILVIKSGRQIQLKERHHFHTGIDAAWDAVIQRAGLLRVQDMHELFSAVETLSHMRPLRGERLMIISNGTALATLAADELERRHGKLAIPGLSLCNNLKEALPELKPVNPLSLGDDATVGHYLQAITALLDNQDYDALLIIHAPGATAPGTLSAEKIIALINHHPKGKYTTLLTNWCGEFSSVDARRQFNEAAIPTYRTPEGAVTAFMHMVEYRRNQKQLRETPTSLDPLPTDTRNVREIIQHMLHERKSHLDTHEARLLLQAYGLDILSTEAARSANEAVHFAKRLGYPVALKLRSPDIPDKSEIQGVIRYLHTDDEIRQAAKAMLERAKTAWPQAQIDGLLVQRMAHRAGASELRIRVKYDPIFGPLIIIGDGGTEAQAAIGLPPLNMNLARYLIIQAIKSEKIRLRYPEQTMDITQFSEWLVKLSSLIVDCPEVRYLDMQLLLAAKKKYVLLDVSLELVPFNGPRDSHLVIRPYPRELEERVVLKNGLCCLLRPILPEDEPYLQQFIAQVTKEDLYYRYFSEINEFTHEDLANMTQIDYDREMAFVAVYQHADRIEILGVTRAISDPDNIDAEFSILVRSDRKGSGLGRCLLEKLVVYTSTHGLQQLNGITMPGNHSMLNLARKLGFSIVTQLDEGIVNLTLPLVKKQVCE